MPSTQDGVEAFAWSALLVLIFRCLSVCAYLFVSVNWDVLFRSSIQVHAGSGSSSKATPPTTRPRTVKRSPQKDAANGSDGKKVPLNRQNSLNRAAKPSNPAQKPGLPSRSPNTNFRPPPPYSLKPLKEPQPQASVDSIVKLYEEIMAADSQTIQVQQDTLCSQQEIIRSQALVIRRMRQVLEEQDVRIEELEHRLYGVENLPQ